MRSPSRCKCGIKREACALGFMVMLPTITHNIIIFHPFPPILCSYYQNVWTITWNPMLNIVGVVSCHRKIPHHARAFSRMLRRAGSTRVTLVLLARVNTTLCWTALWVRWRGLMDAPSSRPITHPPMNPLLSRHTWGVRKECWKNRLSSLEGDGIWLLWNYYASTSSRITWIF